MSKIPFKEYKELLIPLVQELMSALGKREMSAILAPEKLEEEASNVRHVVDRILRLQDQVESVSDNKLVVHDVLEMMGTSNARND